MADVCMYVFADMGSGLYAASKAITVSDLIATVTPERSGESRMGDYGKKHSMRGELFYSLSSPVMVFLFLWSTFFSVSLFFCSLPLVDEILVIQDQVMEVVEESKEDLQNQEDENRATDVSQQSPLTPQKQDTKVTNTVLTC